MNLKIWVFSAPLWLLSGNSFFFLIFLVIGTRMINSYGTRWNSFCVREFENLGVFDASVIFIGEFFRIFLVIQTRMRTVSWLYFERNSFGVRDWRNMKFLVIQYAFLSLVRLLSVTRGFCFRGKYFLIIGTRAASIAREIFQSQGIFNRPYFPSYGRHKFNKVWIVIPTSEQRRGRY